MKAPTSTSGKMTARERRASLIVWGAWIFAFLGFEFGGLSSRTPWRTLSSTAWDCESEPHFGPAARLILDGGLAILRTHVRSPHWPERSA